MSTLSSASTLEQIQAAYDDTASYEEDGSESKCRAFITAARMLLNRYPLEAAHAGGPSLRLPVESIRAELNEARSWLSAHVSGGAVRMASFEEFRA